MESRQAWVGYVNKGEREEERDRSRERREGGGGAVEIVWETATTSYNNTATLGHYRIH